MNKAKSQALKERTESPREHFTMLRFLLKPKGAARWHDKQAKKAKAGKPSFIDELEAHKAEGASFDSGTWKPKHKGQSFIDALEAHKAASAGKFR